jgi:tRNA pseudouridine38-40 synthase
MVVAYDGTDFHGFAAQPGQCTVGGTLAQAIEAVAGHPVELTCAGRTDTGVHARGQVVHVDLVPKARRRSVARGKRAEGKETTGGEAEVDLGALVSACNKMLAPAVVVVEARVAPAGFDARRSAMSRCYRYRVLNQPVPDPFEAPTSWHVAAPLDVSAMRLATDPLLGEQDFSAFCRRPPGGSKDALVRRVLGASWTSEGKGMLVFEIEATSFCHQMVRSIVGTLVEVGKARRRAGEVSAVLDSRRRSAAASPAPPHGLCLWSVRYPPDEAMVGAAAAAPVSW